jgi:hypothetical protein
VTARLQLRMHTIDYVTDAAYLFRQLWYTCVIQRLSRPRGARKESRGPGQHQAIEQWMLR